ncbi:hypothetical protein BKI52_04345 [marine bacterium AO1-C]|nr:hypothetical protein BKI52_04345 [marine bacterium AO1-C]
MIQKYQDDFMHEECWILSFAGGFQRAKVYQGEVSEAKRAQFREDLRTYVEKDILPAYQQKVSEEQHLKNIESVAAYAIQNFASILNNEKLNIGIAQKLLNPQLKYLWCRGKVITPPHFPVDRIIQEKLKMNPIINWTSMQTLAEYSQVIEHAKRVAAKMPDCCIDGEVSLALWELISFQRK